MRARSTQEHIAACNMLLFDQFPDVPPRFRPEKLLSSRPQTSPKVHLKRLAVTIATFVSRSIPEFEFEILSNIDPQANFS